MKYWKLDLPHTPALDLARQMLEDCLKAYEVPAEGENEACRIVCAVTPDPSLPPEGYRMRIHTAGPAQVLSLIHI